MTGPPSTIVWTCRGCGREILVPGTCGGMQTACPRCGTRQLVPRSAATPPPSRPRVNASPGQSTAAVTRPGTAMLPTRWLTALLVPGRSRRIAIGGGVAVATLVVFASALVFGGRRTSKPNRPAPAERADVETTGTDARPDRRSQESAAAAADSAGHDAEGGTGAASLVRTLPPPHRPEELLAGLGALDEAMRKLDPDDPAAERRAALLRLRMYRFLCGLSESDLVGDDRLDEEALAAADICRRLGRLTHAPENPGLPADDHARARRGAAAGNLASGVGSLVRAVDGWMDDSDAANIDALGHRRWCLNPPLRRVGFGRTEGWCAMWAHDASGRDPLRLTAVCYPPPGAVPIDMFRPNHAWSVSLNPRLFRRPRPGEIRVTVRDSRDTVLELEKESVETSGYGIDNCIIFRPRDLATTVGRRYDVTVSGVRDHDDRVLNLSYALEFIVR